jgi:hypothetical protein
MKPVMKNFLIALAAICISFSACIQKPKKQASATQNIPATPLDTIQSKPATITAQPVLFETAFIKGTKDKIKDLTFNLYGITIGNIKITSGRIIACDPFLTQEYGKPFTQAFPTGEFPVQLSIAHLEKKGETIAFARIKFSDEPVAKWEFALLKDQKPIPVGGEEKHGYAVDAGRGTFMDEEALNALDKKTAGNMGHEIYKQTNKNYRNGWNATIYDFDNYNLAAFTSGFGDGRYSTYIGFDASGKPCRLLTDFALFDWKKK